MTISTTASRQDYTGDNCTKVFPYTFKILATTDLDVFVDNCQKLITTDYTVSGAGSDTGGSVTFVTAPGCTLAVAIVRDVPYTQSTDYPESGPFPAAAHEDALDKATMLIQQVKELVTRTWRFAAGSVRAATGYIVDEPVASKYVRVKSDCSGLEYVALTATGTYADPVTTKGDLIVGGNTGAQERLGITAGYTLVADAATGTGKPSWQPGLSVQLTNKLDAALTAGDVVGIDAGCDRAVVARNAQGCVALFVVAPAAIGDDCLALFHLTGLIRNVKSSGAIARGQYVRKSATAQAVEDAGVTMGVSAPPSGTLGVAVTAAAGNLVDVIFTPAGGGGGPENPPIELSPVSATFATGQFPVLTKNVGVNATDYTLDFEDAPPSTAAGTENYECATWERVLPTGLTITAAKLYVQSRQQDSCSGTVGWIVRTRALIDGAAWDAAYTNCDVIVASGVKSTVGQLLQQCVALTTTGWAADSRLRIKLIRNVDADTADGKTKYIGGYIRIT